MVETRLTLIAAPLPSGDLDGDGTADVVVRKRKTDRPTAAGAEEMPGSVELISGRTGARLWSTSLVTERTFMGDVPEHEWIEARERLRQRNAGFDRAKLRRRRFQARANLGA